jgi:hypothetical protein
MDKEQGRYLGAGNPKRSGPEVERDYGASGGLQNDCEQGLKASAQGQEGLNNAH